MRRVVRLATLVPVLLAIFAAQIPIGGQAQSDSGATPVATPEADPGVEIETIGSSIEVAIPGGKAYRDGSELGLYLLRVTLQPGAALPPSSMVPSALIHLDSGRVLVSPSAGEDIWVDVGIGSGGESINSPDGSLVCDIDWCLLEPNEEVLLGPGNSISLTGGSFTVQALEDEPAVLIMGLLHEDGILELCWICPRPPRR